MSEPKFPRNSELVGEKGQIGQPLVRFMDTVKKRAYDYATTFKNIINLTAITSADADNDYLVVYDATDGNPKRISPANLVSSGAPDGTLIETLASTSGSSVTSSTIDFAALKASGYRDLYVRMNAVSCTGGAGVYMDVSDDDGSNWTPSVGTITGLGVSRSTTSISPMRQDSGLIIIAVSTTTTNGAWRLSGFAQSSTAFPKEFSSSSFVNTNFDSFASGHIVGLGAINKIRLRPQSGDFDAGSFSIFAI